MPFASGDKALPIRTGLNFYIPIDGPKGFVNFSTINTIHNLQIFIFIGMRLITNLR